MTLSVNTTLLLITKFLRFILIPEKGVSFQKVTSPQSQPSTFPPLNYLTHYLSNEACNVCPSLSLSCRIGRVVNWTSPLSEPPSDVHQRPKRSRREHIMGHFQNFSLFRDENPFQKTLKPTP